MRGLRLWEFLEVPELRYNRVEIFLGIKWRVPGAGIILSCTPDTDSEGNQLTTGTCTLKLEEGEFGAVSKDDIALGIFHFGDERDAAEDSDDSKGNFKFSGFATTYFRVTEVSGDNNETFRYALRPGYTIHPQPQMNFHATETLLMKQDKVPHTKHEHIPDFSGNRTTGNFRLGILPCSMAT